MERASRTHPTCSHNRDYGHQRSHFWYFASYHHMDLYSHFGLTEQALTGIHGAHSPCQINETYNRTKNAERGSSSGVNSASCLLPNQTKFMVFLLLADLAAGEGRVWKPGWHVQPRPSIKGCIWAPCTVLHGHPVF